MPDPARPPSGRPASPTGPVHQWSKVVRAQAAEGHLGNRMIPVWELPPGGIDVHDGTVGDWEDLVPGPSMDLIDFEGLRDTGYDRSSLAGRSFLGWCDAEQRLYFAIERIDDAYVNLHDGAGPWSTIAHDHADLMVDGDHSGGLYTSLPGDGLSEEEALQFDGLQAQNYMLIAQSPDSQLVHLTIPPAVGAGRRDQGRRRPQRLAHRGLGHAMGRPHHGRTRAERPQPAARWPDHRVQHRPVGLRCQA